MRLTTSKSQLRVMRMRLTTRAQRLAARWRPAGGTAYAYEPQPGRYCAVGYRGTSGRPTWGPFRYPTAARRDAALAEWIAGQTARTRRPGGARNFDPAAPTKPNYSLTETASIVRYLTAQLWPGVRFSVRSESYSMGCAIRVDWTDGPTQLAVADILRVMSHKGFDGMTDSSYYHPPLLWRGALVTFGADSISCSRAESAELLREASKKVSAATGLPLLEVADGQYAGGAVVVPYRWHPDGVVVSTRDGGQWHSQICESLARTLSKCATVAGVEVPQYAARP